MIQKRSPNHRPYARNTALALGLAASALLTTSCLASPSAEEAREREGAMVNTLKDKEAGITAKDATYAYKAGVQVHTTPSLDSDDKRVSKNVAFEVAKGTELIVTRPLIYQDDQKRLFFGFIDPRLSKEKDRKSNSSLSAADLVWVAVTDLEGQIDPTGLPYVASIGNSTGDIIGVSLGSHGLESLGRAVGTAEFQPVEA